MHLRIWYYEHVLIVILLSGDPDLCRAVTVAPVTVTVSAQQRGRLLVVLGLVSTYMVVAATGGWLTGSLGLLADAAHMLTDALGLSLSLGAVWLAGQPSTARRTFGHYRAEILASQANAVLMLGVAVYILWEAYRRFSTPPEVVAGPMMAVAAGGLVINGLAAWLLHQGAGESLNTRAAFFEVLGDLVAAAGVLVAGGVMLATGWRYADPLVSVGIALFIVPRAWGLLRQTMDVLLEATPRHVEVVEAALRSVPGVRAVHDLHVWTITSGMESVTAHLVLDQGTDAGAGQQILQAATRLLDERFGLDHTTLQLETQDLRLTEVPH
jgi:cobalt-zinc-cadmium efflux system protein